MSRRSIKRLAVSLAWWRATCGRTAKEDYQATYEHITHQHQAKPSLSTKSKNQDEKSREKPANANPSQTPKVKKKINPPHIPQPEYIVYSAGTSTLCATPSASPLLTFLPVLAIVLSTLAYGSDSSATTVAVCVSSETS